MRLPSIVITLLGFTLSIAACLSCSNHRPTMTEGRFRLNAHMARQGFVEVENNLEVVVILEGELPPAGAGAQWVLKLENEAIWVSEGVFYPRIREYRTSIFVTAETFWRIAYGRGYRRPNIPTTLETQLNIRLYFYNSIEEDWYVVAEDKQRIVLSCPGCY